MADPAILERLRREVSLEAYRRVRELWKAHSLAEDKRDIGGLLATLTEDCVYEIVSTGDVWTGHEGAATFYRQLLTAFPDIAFELTDIVIGPQGVCEEATVTATHREQWLRFPASGKRVRFRVAIFFPWDPEREKFKGEKVYLETGSTLRA